MKTVSCLSLVLFAIAAVIVFSVSSFAVGESVEWNCRIVGGECVCELSSTGGNATCEGTDPVSGAVVYSTIGIDSTNITAASCRAYLLCSWGGSTLCSSSYSCKANTSYIQCGTSLQFC